ncbi:MAG: pirin family protein [Myxococcales bacterium]|nr:pirin family protein [Myxococcales bacterium]
MLKLRQAESRGHANHGWLDSYHSFSFGSYYDQAHMGFRNLRVINEDRVAPGQGFGTHPHSDMEIVSYVISGSLAHRDSMGNGSTIRPGDVQRMSAGTGVTHSEFNGSRSETVHFLQIWLLPSKRGIQPGYEQKSFSTADKNGTLRLIASPDGRDDSVTIHTDASIYAGVFSVGQQAKLALAEGRHGYVHVVTGQVLVAGLLLQAGDGLAISGESSVAVEGTESGEVLVFDLP